MDFYKKINIDNLKTKLPAFKIPMPTFKSRKIFKSGELPKNSNLYNVDIPEQTEISRCPPATFIERTPRRISTVSSLQENNDDILIESRVNGAYTNYENRDFDEKKSRDGKPNDEGLHQRFTRRYKEFQEFKFKNIFGKRTVVRKTEISMDLYADRYKEDLKMERKRKQQDRQSSIENNFDFQNSKQNSQEDYTSPTISIKSNVSTPLRNQIKELEKSAQRTKECKFRTESIKNEEDAKPKVEYSQSWRFGTLRGKSINRKENFTKKKQSIKKKPVKNMHGKRNNERYRWTLKSQSSNQKHDQNIEVPSEVVAIKKKWTLKKSYEKHENNYESQENSLQQKKNRWMLPKLKPTSVPVDENHLNSPKKRWTLRSSPSIDDEPGKVQFDPNSLQQKKKYKKHKIKPEKLETDEIQIDLKNEAFNSRKTRNWSVKNQFSSSIESYSSAKDSFKKKSWNFKGSKLLSKWKNRTMLLLSQPNLTTVGLEGTNLEQRQKITLRIWKRHKNIKKSASSEDVTIKAEAKSPFLNLKYFTKKENGEVLSVEDVIMDNTKLTHKERLENARDRAKQVVNDRIPKFNFFRAQQVLKNFEDSKKGPKRRSGFDDDLDDEVAAANIEVIQNSPAAIWASEQHFNQSINTLETNDFNINMPKVLIRQQSNENREPTLVITMTSSRLHPHISPLFQGRRLESLDSKDSDSWISNTYNNIIVEKDVNEIFTYTRSNDQTNIKEEKRRKSVEVFKNKAPFANFERELEDTPVISIENGMPPPPPTSSPPRDESLEKGLFRSMVILEEMKTDESNETQKHDIKEIKKNPNTTVGLRSSFTTPTVHPENIPERTASMVNLPRPIIKQGSLRRKLSADLESKRIGGKVNSLINQFENSCEDLTDSAYTTTENSTKLNENLLPKDKDVVKIKSFDVKRKTKALHVPILSPRLTSPEISTAPLDNVPVDNIPIILPVSINDASSNVYNVDSIRNNFNNNLKEVIHEDKPDLRKSIKPTTVHTKEDENYFSLSDEENSNCYSMGNEVPVFTKQSYILEL